MIKEITYKNVKHLLDDWDCAIYVDIEDLDYLDRFLTDLNIRVDIKLVDLCKLYNRFSEEKWLASWKAGAEKQFIKWLKEKSC